MNSEIDINSVIAQTTAEHTKLVLAELKSMGAALGSKLLKAITNPYEAYLKDVVERHCTVKTFFQRERPIPLYNFYVPTSLELRNDEVISPASINRLLKRGRNAIISGIAGSGKSILMRHLTLDTIKRTSLIPIFYELRNTKGRNETLLTCIYEDVIAPHFDISVDELETLLKKGRCAVLLDGLDEVELANQQRVSKEAAALSRRFSKSFFAISTRPDQSVVSWQHFNSYTIRPLTLEEATSLVSLLPTDSEVRGKFIKDLRDSLYEKHSSFCSNPLLLSIMLLVYANNADIPARQSVFFDQAFDALFHRHDAYKGLFIRDKRCALDIMSFGKVFECFCTTTLRSKSIAFSEESALKEIGTAKKVTRLAFAEADFLFDLKMSTCLLIDDGLELTFTHRSFQEHFAARFIANADAQTQAALVAHFKTRAAQDNVVSILHEIRPELIQKEAFLPELELLYTLNGHRRNVDATCLIAVLDRFFDGMEVVRFPDDEMEFIGFFASGEKPRWQLSILNLAYRQYAELASVKSPKRASESETTAAELALVQYLKKRPGQRIMFNEMSPRSKAIRYLEHISLSRAYIQELLGIREYIIKDLAEREASIGEIILESRNS